MGYSGRAGRGHRPARCSGRTLSFQTLLWIRCRDTHIKLDQTGFHSADHLAGTVAQAGLEPHGDFPALVLNCRSYKSVPALPGFSAKISLKYLKVITLCVCNHHTHGGKRTTLAGVGSLNCMTPRISLRLSGPGAVLSPSELSCQPLLCPSLSYCLFPAGIGVLEGQKGLKSHCQ